jgi:hypothetical protein
MNCCEICGSEMTSSDAPLQVGFIERSYVCKYNLPSKNLDKQIASIEKLLFELLEDRRALRRHSEVATN